MLKIVALGLTGLFVTATSPLHAQAPASSTAQATSVESGLPSEADLKAFTDLRVEVIKAALQLTPDQAKLWQPVEDAIRARAMSRRARLARLVARQDEQRDRTPVEFLRERADVLAQRAAGLKRLSEAWQPLYDSLDARQKLRLRVVAVYGLREMKGAFESRLQAMTEEDDED